MEKSYAHALWQAIRGGMTPTEAVHGLHETLKAHGRTALSPRIARAFARICARMHTRDAVTLTVARAGDEHSARTDAASVVSWLPNKSTEAVEVRIDETIIGGWRLEGHEQLVDASYKKQLLDIYAHATQ